MTRVKIIILCLSFCFATNVYAKADQDEKDQKEMGGTIEAIINGKKLSFPSLKTDINVGIKGDLATVKVTQTFNNSMDIPINATYLFPLNKDSAVYGMTMYVGDEIIEAKINKIEKAKKIFKKAKKEGKSAALLVQHRPNMFTHNIANLMPDLPIKVELKYVQTIPRVDGDYELLVPLVVGPRYQPSDSGKSPEIIDDGVNIGSQEIRSDRQFGKWEIEKLPQYPSVRGLNIPDTINKERVSINIKLDSSVPILHAYSKTHKLNIEGEKSYKNITLAKGRVIDNSDFVFRYNLSGVSTQSGFLTHRDERGGFFSMLIEPPINPEKNDITPREMVFVLDTSGSMSGMPIAASKVFMKHALNNLRETDYFRIIQFSSNAKEYTSSPVIANLANIKAAIEYVNSMYASGGTEMNYAIDQAFSMKPMKNTLRLVTFLTDGYIGNEASILGRANEKIGDARIYVFGIGSSVNRYLISEMARVGRGFARIIDPTEDPKEAAQDLAKRIQSPVLTDISVDWGDINVKDVIPERIPDLFTGDSIRIQGKFIGSGSKIITVNGLVNGRGASIPMKVKLDDSKGEAIPLIWARQKIAEYMRKLTKVNRNSDKINYNKIKQKITQLGLEYSLVTKWTSFVAVSNMIYNKKPESAKSSQVPLPKVKGVTSKAYGVFSGSSTPEPQILVSFLIIAIAGLLARRRRAK